jgi:hypothetical protein
MGLSACHQGLLAGWPMDGGRCSPWTLRAVSLRRKSLSSGLIYPGGRRICCSLACKDGKSTSFYETDIVHSPFNFHTALICIVHTLKALYSHKFLVSRLQTRYLLGHDVPKATARSNSIHAPLLCLPKLSTQHGPNFVWTTKFFTTGTIQTKLLRWVTRDRS